MTKNPTPQRLVRLAATDLHKSFRLPHERQSSLKQAVINFRKRSFETFNVLRDINFEVRDGEFFGILGKNGSGKSTLLKLMAGIYRPTSGSITVNGKLTPFIELGIGFNHELTGRENVFLNGAILGLTEKEIAAKYDEIVAFAELERFMDQKLKNYSSGMLVRLAFSIAIRAHNDILLIDEVLAVGDERFQNKCLKVFEEIKKDPTKTVIFVSHDMGSVQRFCDRAMVIHDGDIVFIGDPIEAALEYKKLNFPETVVESQTTGKAPVKLKLTGKDGHSGKVFEHGQTATLHISWKHDERIKNVGVAVFKQDGQYVFGANTILDKHTVVGDGLAYDIELNLGSGQHYFQVALTGDSDTDRIYFVSDGPEFTMASPVTWQGTAFLKHDWRGED